MATADTVRPYVEQLLKEFCETETLVVDHDGDVPIRKGSTMYWVSLFEIDGEAQVKVWSFMARDVPDSDALYRHLNEVNRGIHYGRVYFDDGDVVVSTELLAQDLDPASCRTRASASAASPTPTTTTWWPASAAGSSSPTTSPDRTPGSVLAVPCMLLGVPHR